MASRYHRLHFEFRDILTAWLSRRLEGLTYTVRHGLIRGMKRRGGLGFLPEFLTSEPSAEQRFFGSLSLEGRVVYDVGAFEGVFTLFFSRRAKCVVAYEPHPGNYSRALANLRLNNVSNVELRPMALGESEGSATLTFDRIMPGAASCDPRISQQMVETSDDCQSVTVPVIRLDDDIQRCGLPPPDFVKLDVEGMEMSALRGMSQTLKKHQPDVYLEMHGANRAEKEQSTTALVEFLAAHGYRDLLHVESERVVTVATASVAAEGHLYGKGAGHRPGT